MANPAAATLVPAAEAACAACGSAALRHPVLALPRSAVLADDAPADALERRLAVPACALAVRERVARARHRTDPGQRLLSAIPAAAALVPTALAATGVLVACENLPMSTAVTAPYNYSVSSGAVGAGDAVQSTTGTTLTVSETDADSADQVAILNELRPGDTIAFGGVTYTIGEASEAGTTFVFGISPNTTQTAGLVNITFTSREGASIVFPAPADAEDFNATPPMPIDPGGNATTPVVLPPSTGPAQTPTGGTYPYTLELPVFAWMPLAVGTAINISHVPPFDGTEPPANNATPPPLLTMTRTPPFPAYPT
ncbi:MAG TPA: hypothetical protein VHT52_24590 [Stellaceae bacterium]|nr:hypothetical protein [Stellaceae bacterium]